MGGQNAKGVGGQENDHLGNAAYARNGRIGNVVHGIAHAGVLGEAGVVKVELPGHGIHNHILHQGAEPDGVVNVGFVLGREVDALGVAAALDVEHTVGRPAVLVVANELPVGVGRQGGLAGAGQAKEDGRLMGHRIHVGRAVHGQDAFLGQHIVHGGEHALLDLTSVLGTADDDEMRLIVDHNRASEWTPSMAGSHLKPGAAMTV